MYGTTDLATLNARVVDLHASLILYVVDNRQATHFEQVFRAAVLAGICQPNQVEHIGFGTVNGPDGRPFKTRAGGVMKLRELLDAANQKAAERVSDSDKADGVRLEFSPEIARRIANAAIKFADLSNHRLSNYNFDLDRFMSFEGKTGPYLLYSIVRLQSILKRVVPSELSNPAISAPASIDERNLQLSLIGFAENVERSLDARAPNILCEYGYEVAQAFSKFYSKHHILSEPDSAKRLSWLAVCLLTLRTLTKIMDLLAIDTVDAM
jgi:arginyl-tRNA synthetase